MKILRTLAFFLVILCAIQALALAKTAKKAVPQDSGGEDASIVGFFKSEAAQQSYKNLDFQIMGGYADLRGELPEASGRYFLAAHNVAPVSPDIYKLELTFKHKLQRDVIDFSPEYFFTQMRTYYFWYDGGNRLVFKVGGGKKSIKIARKEITHIQVLSPETYNIEHQKNVMDIQFQDGDSHIYLQLKFI
jgi:hypothetical protein